MSAPLSLTPVLGRALAIAAMMIITAASIQESATRAGAPLTAPTLDDYLPETFAEWRRTPLGAAILPAEAELGPGEAVAYRAYQDRAGRVVTLVVAYGPPLGDSVRLHRPESCYRAQGFSIADRDVGAIRDDTPIPVVRLDTENALRREAVTYWLRDGDAYVTSAAAHGWLDLQRGADADGALVRVSSKGAGDVAFTLHEEFLNGLIDSLTPEGRRLLLAGSGA